MLPHARLRDLLCIVTSAEVASVIAVAGTLLGSALTYVFQRLGAGRQREVDFGLQLRAERLAAYGAFVTALSEFRRGQLDWYNRRLEDPAGAAAAAARAESYRLRGVVMSALAQVQLVARDPGLTAAAAAALDVTRRVHDAEDSAARVALETASLKSQDAFVALASAEVQAPPAASSRR